MPTVPATRRTNATLVSSARHPYAHPYLDAITSHHPRPVRRVHLRLPERKRRLRREFRYIACALLMIIPVAAAATLWVQIARQNTPINDLRPARRVAAALGADLRPPLPTLSLAPIDSPNATNRPLPVLARPTGILLPDE